ncbi:MAG TPA: HAD family hydrolase [Paraburkholderia sp.]
MIKMCILDFDGTLSDTHDAIVWGVQKTFDYFNVERPPDEAIVSTIHAGLAMPDVIRRLLGQDCPLNQVTEWTNRYRAIYDEEALPRTQLFPGVEKVLEHMKQRGVGLAIVSNKGTTSVCRALIKFKIDHLIDLVIGNQPHLAKKPDPQVYRDCVKPRFPQVPPSDILVVGDTHVDIQFARAIGARACWAIYGYGRPDICRSLDPEIAITAFEGLLQEVE